jgi:type IV pilus assembly protein PilE
VNGFTLIELVITIGIVAIISAIAIAVYSAQIRESRRTDAKTALMDIATREEQFYATSNVYTLLPANVGYSGTAFPLPVGSGYYNVALSVNAPIVSAGGIVTQPAGYVLTATPIGNQTADTACALFQLTQTGVQSSLNSGGTDSTSICWH